MSKHCVRFNHIVYISLIVLMNFITPPISRADSTQVTPPAVGNTTEYSVSTTTVSQPATAATETLPGTPTPLTCPPGYSMQAIQYGEANYWSPTAGGCQTQVSCPPPCGAAGAYSASYCQEMGWCSTSTICTGGWVPSTAVLNGGSEAYMANSATCVKSITQWTNAPLVNGAGTTPPPPPPPPLP